MKWELFMSMKKLIEKDETKKGTCNKREAFLIIFDIKKSQKNDSKYYLGGGLKS